MEAPVPLSPKAFQLLELLLDRRPEAIAKTELLERLWPEHVRLRRESAQPGCRDPRRARGRATGGAVHPHRAAIRLRLPWRRTASAGPHAAQAPDRPVRVSSRPAASGFCPTGPNVVGRDPDCAVRIDSVTLSRRHAQIVVTNAEATIEDLGSKNGTHVNGSLVTQPVALRDGDQIEVGSVTLTYRLTDAEPSTLTRRGM